MAQDPRGKPKEPRKSEGHAGWLGDEGSGVLGFQGLGFRILGSRV